jgi:hypothetical protein
MLAYVLGTIGILIYPSYEKNHLVGWRDFTSLALVSLQSFYCFYYYGFRTRVRGRSLFMTYFILGSTGLYFTWFILIIYRILQIDYNILPVNILVVFCLAFIWRLFIWLGRMHCWKLECQKWI